MAWAGVQQEDSAVHTTTAHCGSGAVHSSALWAAMGGTAGTVNNSFTVPNDNTSRVYVNWSETPSVANQPSLVPGLWDVPLNITSGSSLVEIGGVWICHEDSAGVAIETIAQYNVAGNKMTTGIHTITFNNAAPTTWKASDRIVYVIAYIMPSGFFAATIRHKFDQKCFYPLATADWRGVTLGGGFADQKREGVL